jgi:hypothetical protein
MKHSSAKKSYCYCRCRRDRTALALSATPVSMHRCEAWWGLGAVWKTSFRSKTVAEDAQAQARQHVARAQRMRQQGTEGARLYSISSSLMGWFRSKRGICVDLYGSEDKRVCTANKLALFIGTKGQSTTWRQLKRSSIYNCSFVGTHFFLGTTRSYTWNMVTVAFDPFLEMHFQRQVMV